MTINEQHLSMIQYLRGQGFSCDEALKPADIKYMYDQIYGSVEARAQRLPPDAVDCYGTYVEALSTGCVFPDGTPCAQRQSCEIVSLIQVKAEQLEEKRNPKPKAKKKKTPPVTPPTTKQKPASPPTRRPAREKDEYGFMKGSASSEICRLVITESKDRTYDEAIQHAVEQLGKEEVAVRKSFSNAKNLMKSRNIIVDMDKDGKLIIPSQK